MKRSRSSSRLGKYGPSGFLKNVQFAAQRDLEKASGLKIPQQGDLFASKQDLQPIGHMDTATAGVDAGESTNTWL